MSFFEIIGNILIGPLTFVFELIYSVAYRMIGDPGMAIIALSLAINILVLPLYKRADAMQEEARNMDAKLHRGIAHIKKTFSGDERMMILQTYYRQNHYSPLSALNGSVSLLLEIPFFMAAYQFLSHIEGLDGIAFGPIANLGAPDGMIALGGVSLNLLPILMTLVNVVSSTIYLKGFPLKTKIQLYGMALFFLVFLYQSPSCLVFYWTLNNVFALVKTIFYKLKNPKKTLKWLGLIAGVSLLFFAVFVYDGYPKRRIFVAGMALVLMMPAVLSCLKLSYTEKKYVVKTDQRQFIFCGMFLTILVGVLIPSNFIAASPQEYVYIHYFYHPLWYVVSAVSIAAGLFLVWMNVFYWLADSRVRTWMEKGLWMLCGVMLADYLFFGTDLGIISRILQYENGMDFSIWEQAVNLGILLLVAAAMYVLSVKKAKFVGMVVLTAMIAAAGMSGMNIHSVCQSINQIYRPESSDGDLSPGFRLSKEGKNVIVLMLDRAAGMYMPYLINEKPELKELFSGFTYFPNTISFAGMTNMGVPALLGGYEYTPVEMNKRKTELLVSKHNEAIKVMPVLFSENGFETTVCDPPYANYQSIPDLSIFDDYPQIAAYITEGNFSTAENEERVIAKNKRNFFWFSLMKTMPLAIQPTLYAEGRYNEVVIIDDGERYIAQAALSLSEGLGMNNYTMDSYNVLLNLPTMTEVVDEATDTFLFLLNNITHEPMILQTPEYVPAYQVDNVEYDALRSERFITDKRTLKMETIEQMGHYHVNMAAMLQLGNWFDYLREHDVYDNTRIIIVSDHCRALEHTEDLILERNGQNIDLERYYPLLMVKDFDSQGFEVSDEFMTNADVPTLATEGIIENPVNPFTGKAINNQEKYNHPQYVSMSFAYDVLSNNGYQFVGSPWLSVQDDIWNKDNWKFYDEWVVLEEHAAP